MWKEQSSLLHPGDPTNEMQRSIRSIKESDPFVRKSIFLPQFEFNSSNDRHLDLDHSPSISSHLLSCLNSSSDSLFVLLVLH